MRTAKEILDRVALLRAEKKELLSHALYKHGAIRVDNIDGEINALEWVLTTRRLNNDLCEL